MKRNNLNGKERNNSLRYSEGCKNLEYINISWCENVQNRGVQAILHGCPKLSTLICRGCEGVSNSLHESFFFEIADCWKTANC